ncbi:MAG: peptidoglycan DD-metalloendopeptidase family protein [Bacillota bacterium]|nr:peptidoglycan DD-metalloendopeptidase family protein [Bacillota bacterium]
MQILHKLRQAGSRRVGAFALALVMVFGALVAAGPQAFAVTKEEINNLKSQASSLSAQKSDLQNQLNKLQNSKNAAIDQKFLLEEKISVIQQQITVSEEAIAKYGEMIALKEVELAEAKEEEAKYYAEFCERVRSMEERGDISYWAVLFNASSFSDLLDRVNAISEVVDYDNMVMDQLAAARQAVADAKAELEENKAAEEATKAELASQKADLETEQAKVDAVISQITSQADVYEEKLHDLEDDSANLSKQIQQAEATYAAQIAAQKKAEEEARKKAAEEEARRQQQLQQQQQQQNNGSSSSSSSTGTASSGGYLWPLSGYRSVTSPFGWRNCPFHGREFHSGVDIPAPSGTPIRATKSGVVIVSTYGSSYGNYVVVAHSDGGRSLYAHMSSRAVSAGQTVSQGQTLGGVGTTGSSTGNHLHFELWMGNSESSRVNPVAYCS